MQNVSFLKEALNSAQNKNTLIELNSKQHKVAIPFTINELLENKQIQLVLVNTTQDISELQEQIGETFNKILIVDTISEGNSSKNIFYTNSPTDLTKIQIGIEKLSNDIKKPKIIIFDSLNNIAIHSDNKNAQRFFYLFNNKAKLEGNSVVILTIKESTDENTLETVKQFCDKIYDYTDLFVSSIELKD